uniref:Reverse transcriptase domain-containing protein n=1 Tax=Tanacetum cinerariifolium TaxID=118510 RepID=A0A6L2JE47_TANCI|nr:hypothetical protein [Tanacetum cinerariifolium]
MSCKSKIIQKESIRIESSIQHSSVNHFVVINIPEEDVEPKQIILDPDGQLMWESAMTVAPTPNSAIIQLDVDDNFVVNTTHLNMIRENKFDAYLWSDPHNHIHEFLAICNMFRYGHDLTKGAITQIFYHGLDEPTQEILDIIAGGIFLYKSPNQAFQLLEDKVLFKFDWSTKSQNEHYQKSVSFADSLNEELQDIRNKYNELKEGNTSKYHLNDDTPVCEHHEANYIQFEGYLDRNSHDSHSHQSHHDRNDSEKSLTEINNDVRNDLEDFKRCIHSMRIDYDKLFARDDAKTTGVLPKKKSKPVNQEPQSITDFKKSITKFLDGQKVTNMLFQEQC